MEKCHIVAELFQIAHDMGGNQNGMVLIPGKIAENIQKQGGFIEGVRPGLKTETYFRTMINRLNLFGALALGLIAMLPFITDYIFILALGYPVGLSLSGTGLLIVVTVGLENLRSLDSRALMVTYDDFNNGSKH